MTTPPLDELIASMPKLASYAGVLNELDEVLNDMNSTLTEICEVIEKDPAMAAKLLKLGNTCFFGFSRRVETVFDTISLIGIQQVRDLIAASTVMRMFDGVSSEHSRMSFSRSRNLPAREKNRPIHLSGFLQIRAGQVAARHARQGRPGNDLLRDGELSEGYQGTRECP